jgi:hypothetical protein
MSNALLVALLLLCTLAQAGAHERTTSFSTWDIQGQTATITLRLSLLDASRFPWFTAPDSSRRLDQYVTQHLALAAAGTPCPLSKPVRRLPAPPERLLFEWRVACAASGAFAIRSDLLLDVAPTHLHFSRVSVDGRGLGEHVFSETQRSWQLSATGSAAGRRLGTSFLEYVTAGLGHILTGSDHLAFLLVLLLLTTRLADVAQIVTGFTIGHSITLALAGLAAVHPARGAVGSLIGLSIVLIAAEDLWFMSRRPAIVPWLLSGILATLAVAAYLHPGTVPAVALGGLALFTLCYLELVRPVRRPWRVRWRIAFLFGLVHGFGFAGVLVEADLPADRLAQALLGFNLGVELGQIGIVLLVWPLALILARQATERTRLLSLEVAGAAALAVGVFWFVTRTYG